MSKKYEDKYISEQYRAIPKLHSFVYTQQRGHGKGKKRIKYVTSYKYAEVKIESFEDFKKFFVESGWCLVGKDFYQNPVIGKGVVFYPKDVSNQEELFNQLHCELTIEDMYKIANHKTVKKMMTIDGLEYKLILKINEIPGW